VFLLLPRYRAAISSAIDERGCACRWGFGVPADISRLADAPRQRCVIYHAADEASVTPISSIGRRYFGAADDISAEADDGVITRRDIFAVPACHAWLPMTLSALSLPPVRNAI